LFNKETQYFLFVNPTPAWIKRNLKLKSWGQYLHFCGFNKHNREKKSKAMRYFSHALFLSLFHVFSILLLEYA